MTCVAGQRPDCPALDLCYGVGTCNPQTGVCSSPFLPQGASCPTGSPCAVGTCDGAGTCVATPVNEGGACAGGVCAGGACCTPTTCWAQGATCGTIPDGCGATIDCGCCPQGCNGRCWTVADGCGGTIHCGSCGGCFIAGSRVAMADGSSRQIELITIGDCVLGRDGRVNRVVGLARPILGDGQLFALNGRVPFVNAGHPFLTPEGWKSIDPVASAAEVPSLPISRLAVGDRLLSLTPAAVPMLVGGPEFEDGLDAQQAPVPLRSVDGRAASPTTQLFNLEVDGNHTYFADDLLVHNKPSK